MFYVHFKSWITSVCLHRNQVSVLYQSQLQESSYHSHKQSVTFDSSSQLIVLSINQAKKKVHSRSEKISLHWLVALQVCSSHLSDLASLSYHSKVLVMSTLKHLCKPAGLHMGSYVIIQQHCDFTVPGRTAVCLNISGCPGRSLNCWCNLYRAPHNLLELNYAMSSCSYYFTSSNMSFPCIYNL